MDPVLPLLTAEMEAELLQNLEVPVESLRGQTLYPYVVFELSNQAFEDDDDEGSKKLLQEVEEGGLGRFPRLA